MRGHGLARMAATALALAGAAGAALANPLDTLLARGNGSACFERVYDAAHLAGHPGQKTREMLLSLRQEERDFDGAVLRLRIREAKRVLYIVGDCSYAEEANLDAMGEKLIAAFKGPDGLDCHAYVSADLASAEEGGDFPIDLRDGKAVVVYFPDALAAWRSVHQTKPADFVDFGSEDQVFKLNRIDPASCRQLTDSIPKPE